MLLAGDIQQNPGPNVSCSGDLRTVVAATTTEQATVDTTGSVNVPQNDRCLPFLPLNAAPASANGTVPMFSTVRGKVSIHKQCNFLLLQTANHAKILWDPHAKPKGLLGEHLNIRSVASKTDQLEKLLTDSNLDFLCLSESWLTDSSPDEGLHGALF